MEIIHALTIIIAAYDILLVPIIVFRRTSGDRNYWLEIGFSLGVALLLLGRVLVSVVQGNNHWYGAPLTLVACVLIASVSWSIVRPRR